MSAAREPRLRTIGLIAPLLLVLAFAIALALQAVTETRLRREAAQRTLTDYADFAAYILANVARQELERRLLYAFGPLRRYDAASGEPLPPPGALAQDRAEARRCAEDGIDEPTYFRLDLARDTLDVAGAPLDPAMQRWLADTLAAEARAFTAEQFVRQLFTDGRVSEIVAHTMLRDSAGAPLAVYGKTHCLSISGRSVFALALNATPALPPALTGGVPNDSLLSIRVTEPNGHVLYESPVQYPARIVGYLAPSPQWGGLQIAVHIRPEMADRLVSGVPYGGPPRALFLLLMIVMFGTIAVIQVRRQLELVRMRERFVSSVSHELRTPLQQILVFSQLLRMEGLHDDAERHHSVSVIEREAQRLIQLVENVLRFARAARGDDPLVIEELPLAPFLHDTVTTFQPLAAGRGTAIVLHAEAPATVRADANALRPVLLNLLENAVKYGPPGQTVTVTVSTRAGRARITVDDQGPGITPAQRERIWRPYERLERSGDQPVTGSGMGLAIVLDLVQRMDGTVHVEDAPGAGARFVIELPAG
jgi:signal transduction histidine kinase